MANELGGEVDAVENFAWKNWDDPHYKNEYKNTNTVDDIKNICRDPQCKFYRTRCNGLYISTNTMTPLE